MTKEKKIKIKKWAARIGTGFLAFAAGLAATFFLVPNRIKNIVFDDPEEETGLPDTYFSRFVSRIMDTINVDNDKRTAGVVGNIENLKVEWPDKENVANSVEVNGSLALDMRNLNDFDVTLDLGVVYNTKTVDLAIGYTGRDFYLAFQDLYIKSSYNTTEDLIHHLNKLFFNPNVDESEGLGIKLDVDSFIGDLVGGFDIGSLMSGAGGGIGFTTGDEIDHGTTIEAPLSISLGEGKEPIEISLFMDKETEYLTCADLKSVQIGDIKISGKVNLNIVEGHTVYPLDDVKYDGFHNFKDKHFIEVINYKSWFDDIFNLLNKKTVGIDLDFSVDQVEKNKSRTNIGEILGKIDVDLSKFDLFDYIPKVIDADLFSKDKVVTREVTKDEEGNETVVEKILDNISAGLDLSVNRDDDHYADLNLTYADQNAYLSLNEDVIKAKIDLESLNLIIDKVSPLIEGDSNEKVRRLVNGEEPEQGAFDFVTKSQLVEDIKKGHFEGLVDVLESVTSSESGINVKLNLESLGFGPNSSVELTLDAGHDETRGVTSLKCHEIEMAEGVFQLDLNTRPYKQENIDKVLNVKDTYQSLDFVTGVFDQVSTILDSKKTGFQLEGSILGSDQLGMSFDGKGLLDYGEKYGYASINIYNHKNAENPAEKSETHPVKVYVDNTSNDPEKNDMKLAYGPNEKLKGKLSIQSLNDIVDVVKYVIDKQDRRFMKFLDPFIAIIYDSAIGQIIQQKDYLQLASSGFVQKIAQNNEGTYLELDLNKNLFANLLAEDMKIHLNFCYKDGVKQLESIEIINLVLSNELGHKAINLKVTLLDFNKEAIPNPVKLDATYMDFSSLATLVQFGIESTELNSYHLTASVDLDLYVIPVAQINLDFYIEVTGEETKVYGTIPDIPHIIIASADYKRTRVCSEFLFEPAKHYNTSSLDNVGGYFHILRNEDHDELWNVGFEQYYYRASSKAFVADIAGYLLSAVLDFNFDLVSKVGKINLDTTAGTADYESMFKENGFKDASKGDGKNFEWDIGMNLDKVSGIQALKTLDAQLYGSKTTDSNGVEHSYLNKLVGKLVVQASIVVINVNATIQLVDIDPDAKSWKDQFMDIDARFEKVCGIYNNMNETEKANFDATYLDKANEGKFVTLDSKMPAIFN